MSHETREGDDKHDAGAPAAAGPFAGGLADGRLVAVLDAWAARCVARGLSSEHCQGPEAHYLVTAVETALRRGTQTPHLGRASRSWGVGFSSPGDVVATLACLRETLVDGRTTPRPDPASVHRVLDQTMLEAVDAASGNLRSAARTDPLTACANRRALSEDLRRAMASARHGDLDLAVVAIDLDGLKKINDSHGHAAGDSTLVSLVSTLRRSLRESDSLYRVGGDEFVVLAPFTDAAGARELMRRVERMGGPAFSWGVADTAVVTGADGTALLDAADSDLYERRRARRRHGLLDAQRRRALTAMSVFATVAAGVVGIMELGGTPGSPLQAPNPGAARNGGSAPGGIAGSGSAGGASPTSAPPGTASPPGSTAVGNDALPGAQPPSTRRGGTALLSSLVPARSAGATGGSSAAPATGSAGTAGFTPDDSGATRPPAQLTATTQPGAGSGTAGQAGAGSPAPGNGPAGGTGKGNGPAAGAGNGKGNGSASGAGNTEGGSATTEVGRGTGTAPSGDSTAGGGPGSQQVGQIQGVGSAPSGATQCTSNTVAFVRGGFTGDMPCAAGRNQAGATQGTISGPWRADARPYVPWGTSAAGAVAHRYADLRSPGHAPGTGGGESPAGDPDASAHRSEPSAFAWAGSPAHGFESQAVRENQGS